MSQYNQVGDFSLAQILARRYTTPDPNPAPTLEPGIFPSVTLESDRPEWPFLYGGRLWQGFGTQALDAANFSGCAINNPLGSRTIVVIESLAISTGSGVSWYRVPTQPGTNGNTMPRDFRFAIPSPNFNATVTITQFVAAALPLAGEMARFANASTSETFKPVNIILAPGTALQIMNRAINTAITIIAQGYERAAQPSELV